MTQPNVNKQGNWSAGANSTIIGALGRDASGHFHRVPVSNAQNHVETFLKLLQQFRASQQESGKNKLQMSDGGGDAEVGTGKKKRRKKKPVSKAEETTMVPVTVQDNGFTIYKGEDGRSRWVSISSTSFKDKQDEYVSLKALTDDVDRSDILNDYGPLLWWHDDDIRLGPCDFRAIHSKSLIESGTFDDERIAERLARSGHKFQVSIKFRSPSRSDDGVYDYIKTIERSLCPEGKAINPFTSFHISNLSTEEAMDTLKHKALANIIGEDAVNRIIANTENTEKSAQDAGILSKAQDPVEATTTLEPAKAEEGSPSGDGGETENPAPTTDTENVNDISVADLSLQEFGAFITHLVTPLVAGVQAKAESEETRKSQEIAKAFTQLSAQLTAQQDALAKTQTALARLIDDAPQVVAQKGYQASQAQDTALSEERAKAFGSPTADDQNGIQDFITNFALGAR